METDLVGGIQFVDAVVRHSHAAYLLPARAGSVSAQPVGRQAGNAPAASHTSTLAAHCHTRGAMFSATLSDRQSTG
jgi:hypothetical protein